MTRIIITALLVGALAGTLGWYVRDYQYYKYDKVHMMPMGEIE